MTAYFTNANGDYSELRVIYLLIVNYHSTDLIRNLINSINNNFQKYQVIVINNSAEDQTIDLLKSELVTVVHNQENLGFGQGCNLGLELIYQRDQNAIVWIINPDAYFQGIDFELLESFFDHYPEISILGTIIYDPDQKIWFGGGIFDDKSGKIKDINLFTKNQNLPYIECDWVSGCSMIINLKKFAQCPQFDPAYFLYYEDFDFCQRYLKTNHKIAITNQFRIVHQPSSITNRNLTHKIYHSTYSYLLTLEKYTNFPVFMLKLSKLLINTLILMFYKPSIALGKIKGISDYFSKRLNCSKMTNDLKSRSCQN
jgi:N-acetylglucosaminyl-diphospho-decaprenol L-rhamnosyltransferase